MLVEQIRNNSQNQIDYYSSRSTAVKLALFDENSKNVKDPNKIASLQQQLDYFDDLKSNSEKTRDRNISSVSTNPDAVRASLYTNNYLENMSKALSTSEESTKFLDNPAWKATMELNRFNREVQKDKLASDHWDKEFALKEKEHDLNVKLAAKKGVGTQKDIADADKDNYLPSALPNPESKTYYKHVVEEQYSQKVSELNDINRTITIEAFKEITPKNTGETEFIYDQRIRELVDNSSKNSEEFISAYASKKMVDWGKNPDSAPAGYLEILERQNNAMRSASVLESKIKEMTFQRQVLINAFNSIDQNQEDILTSESILAQEARNIMYKLKNQ